MQPEILNQSDEDILGVVRQELEAILGVRGEPEFAEVCWHRQSMPQYYAGHCDRIAQIRELTDTIPGLELAGNAYTGVGIPDCITSGESAAERAFATLTQPH